MLTDLISAFVLPLDFGCTILNDNRLLSNVYHVKLGVDLVEEEGNSAGIGFQRIKYLTDYYLQNSIFLDQNTDLFKDLDKLDNNLVCFPCETYDAYIGSILMSKFQSITEKYFEVQYLSIASLIGDYVQYNLLSPYDLDLELDGDHWWNQDNVYTGSKKLITWEELNLTETPKFKPVVVKGGLSEH